MKCVLELTEIGIPGNVDTWRPDINHVAVIGEVYDDRIVIYDGSYMVENYKDFKVTIKLPKENSIEAERNALREIYGGRGNNWGGRGRTYFSKQ